MRIQHASTLVLSLVEENEQYYNLDMTKPRKGIRDSGSDHA